MCEDDLDGEDGGKEEGDEDAEDTSSYEDGPSSRSEKTATQKAFKMKVKVKGDRMLMELEVKKKENGIFMRIKFNCDAYKWRDVWCRPGHMREGPWKMFSDGLIGEG